MAFVAAKCSQCGASIQIDDTQEKGFCTYCGTEFVTEKLISNYITNYKVVNNDNRTVIKNIYGREQTEVEVYLKSADVYMEMHAWSDAEAKLSTAERLDPTDWRVWFGRLRITTKDFTDLNDGSVNYPKNYGWYERYAKNFCKNFGTAEDFEWLNKFLNDIEEKKSEAVRQRQLEQEAVERRSEIERGKEAAIIAKCKSLQGEARKGYVKEQWGKKIYLCVNCGELLGSNSEDYDATFGIHYHTCDNCRAYISEVGELISTREARDKKKKIKNRLSDYVPLIFRCLIALAIVSAVLVPVLLSIY